MFATCRVTAEIFSIVGSIRHEFTSTTLESSLWQAYGQRQRRWPMAYVIAEPCIGTKDTACVDACPVDCLHPKKDTTYDAARQAFYTVPHLDIPPLTPL